MAASFTQTYLSVHVDASDSISLVLNLQCDCPWEVIQCTYYTIGECEMLRFRTRLKCYALYAKFVLITNIPSSEVFNSRRLFITMLFNTLKDIQEFSKHHWQIWFFTRLMRWERHFYITVVLYVMNVWYFRVFQWNIYCISTFMFFFKLHICYLNFLYRIWLHFQHHNNKHVLQIKYRYFIFVFILILIYYVISQWHFPKNT